MIDSSNYKKLLTQSDNLAFNIAHTSTDDRVISEAIFTELTSTGARIGSWDIIVENRKYDIINNQTNEIVSEKLFLYEAAYAIVKRLHYGLPMTDEVIISILAYENEYMKHNTDVLNFKEQMKCNEYGSSRYAILEDRCLESQMKARDLYNKIVDLSGLGWKY